MKEVFQGSLEEALFRPEPRLRGKADLRGERSAVGLEVGTPQCAGVDASGFVLRLRLQTVFFGRLESQLRYPDPLALQEERIE